ncbi:hypothetical protein DMP17_42080 [Pseudonocardia sp. TMWB2A]|uniref:DUF4333 domain-containing protein n=1 Tax=unclassified Pseudonocardia TaxID=2619320 RepID=UPI001CF6713D
MSARSAAPRTAVAVVLAALVATATVGCGASGAATAPSTTAVPSASPAATSTPSTADATADPAGVEAPPAQATVDPGEGAVAGPDVARSVSAELTRIVGRSPDSVTCPDLPAKVGSAVRCTLVDGADSYGVAVTTTSVQVSDVNFAIKVDDQPS